MERRLAAILAADIVGYSRLMEADETGVLAALTAMRAEIFDPLVAAHRGRVVKLMGDGTLVEFASVVDAVSCAVEIQRRLAKRNAGRSPAKRLELRIGINLGDVIVTGDDLYGDGVNVTARLEALAEPGGICVSRTVVDHARGKVDFGFEDLGEQRLKNIAEPVRVYRVTPEAPAAIRPATSRGRLRRRPVLAAATAVVLAVAALLAWLQPWRPGIEPASEARMAFPLPDRPSIAVLPFSDLSGETGNAPFADGMTEDLITDLSKVSGLFVIARNSTFAYRGT